MIRAANQFFLKWKDDPNRYVLLIRGARQVGKTYAVRQLGETSFSSFVEINFELLPDARHCFKSLNPQDIVAQLEVMVNVTITPGQTLLFLDEIQACPEAIVALRYFKELMPALHVIAAGSLIEFALDHISFGVGRVQSFYMYPLSFTEFLTSLGEDKLVHYLSEVFLTTFIPTGIHTKCVKLVRDYMVVGGMPAAVNRYVETQKYIEAQTVQTVILSGYRSDFGKYLKKPNYELLEVTFNRIPALIGHHIKYTNIHSETKAADIKAALWNLEKAGLLYKVHATAASGFPLGAQIKENQFKTYYVDIGLAQNVCGLHQDILMAGDIQQINAGSMAEQLVFQELTAYSDPFTKPDFFYWARQEKNSSAEVDFLLPIDARTIPIEVKAGKTGRLKSLQLFLNEKRASFGVRISSNDLEVETRILSVPFYLINRLPALISEQILRSQNNTALKSSQSPTNSIAPAETE